MNVELKVYKDGLKAFLCFVQYFLYTRLYKYVDIKQENSFVTEWIWGFSWIWHENKKQRDFSIFITFPRYNLSTENAFVYFSSECLIGFLSMSEIEKKVIIDELMLQ